MPVPTINPLPQAPARSDGPVAFNALADPFIAALPPFVLQANALALAINNALISIASSVDAAAGSASAAATSANAANSSKNAAAQQVGLAADQVALATTQANSAQASAAAAQAAAGLPSLAGSAGKFLGVNPAASGVDWYDVGQKVGDTLTTARVPDASYLQMNGGVYLQSAYPALFSVLGLIGGDVGVSWSSVGSGYTSVTKIVRGDNGTMVGITNLSNTVVRSVDNGLTWSAITAGTGTLAVDIDTDGNGKWMILLSSGSPTIRRSLDDGLTWANGPAVGSSNMVFCQYVASNTWFAGGGNQMFRSTNNGVSFTTDNSKAPNTGAVLTTDRNGTCVLYISGGTTPGVFRSIDGFATTTANPAGVTIIPSAGACDGAGTWVLVSTGGTALKSIDNAATFTAFTYGTAGDMRSVATNGKGVWLLGGAQGVLRRSKDNLNNWDAIAGVSGAVKRLVLTDVAAIAGSDNGQIYRSAPSYSYDTATQFRIPQDRPAQGLSSYIKAKVTP